LFSLTNPIRANKFRFSTNALNQINPFEKNMSKEAAEPTFRYMPVDDVVSRIIDLSEPGTRIVDIPVTGSCGSVLVEDVKALRDLPLFDTAHFDGYAVNSKSLIADSARGVVRLQVVGKSEVDCGFTGSLGRMGAVYTVTGARICEGADTLVPIEKAQREGKYIKIISQVKPGEQVVKKGSDIRKGELLREAGNVIRPQDLMAFMEMEMRTVRVYRKPSIAVLSIGDELTDRLEDVPPKKLETHGKMLLQLIKDEKAIPLDSGIIGDDPKQIADRIQSLLADNDVVVTIGGTSMGIKDFTCDALSKLKDHVSVARGIAVQPGRVTSVSSVGGKLVIALPGHVQGMVGGALFVLLPLIRHMNHRAPDSPFRIRAVMKRRLEAKEWTLFKRIRFVKIKKSSKGYSADYLPGDSSMIGVLVRSDGFIVVPEGSDAVEKGAEVEVFPITLSTLSPTL
jgi:molybdopterin molybdotransferase